MTTSPDEVGPITPITPNPPRLTSPDLARRTAKSTDLTSPARPRLWRGEVEVEDGPSDQPLTSPGEVGKRALLGVVDGLLDDIGVTLTTRQRQQLRALLPEYLEAHQLVVRRARAQGEGAHA